MEVYIIIQDRIKKFRIWIMKLNLGILKNMTKLPTLKKLWEACKKNLDLLLKNYRRIIVNSEYICDDRNVLENLQKIKNMTDEEFEIYLKNKKCKNDE